MEGAIHHWDFLEEIEAPMWVDLTLEAEFMEHDIDDAWFHVSHPIHQLSSGQLKSLLRAQDKLSSPKLSCKSPKLPDSVSRSRGKHYKSKKWSGNKHGVSIDKQHPIRKLGGKSFGVVVSSSVGGSNSSSTVTRNSSMRKTICNIKSCSAAESSSTGSVASKRPSLRSKLSIRGPRNNSSATSAASKVSSGISSLGSAVNPRGSSAAENSAIGEIESEKHRQVRKSSSCKSSVGSTYSIKSKHENTDSVFVLKVDKHMGSKIAMRSLNVLKASENQNSNSRNQRKGTDVKSTCQGSKSKVLGSSVSRKPLCLRNESMPVKNRSAKRPALNSVAGNLNSVASCYKENTAGGKIQNLKTTKHSKSMKTGNVLSKPQGKANGENQARNLANMVPRTYFR